jgi:protein-tyrosine phosphatase
MIDIHSHVLPGLDDGSRSIEESIMILKQMASLGFHHVVATPHYITGSSYRSNNETKMKLIQEIQNQLNKENIDITLYLGNEVYIDNDIPLLVEKKEIAPINESKYLLIELPRNGKINDLNDLLFKLRTKNIIPILAHPERYQCLQEYPAYMDELVVQGALFQVNFESIHGKYGKHAKKLAEYILKHKKFHFLATDIHHMDSSFFKEFPTLKKEIIKIIGPEKFREVTVLNPSAVLKGEFINSEFAEEKKKKFKIFKN